MWGVPPFSVLGAGGALLTRSALSPDTGAITEPCDRPSSRLRTVYAVSRLAVATAGQGRARMRLC